MKLGNSGYGYSSIVVITILPPCPALPFPAAWCATIVRHCLSFPLAPSQGQRGGGGGNGFPGILRISGKRAQRSDPIAPQDKREKNHPARRTRAARITRSASSSAPLSNPRLALALPPPPRRDGEFTTARWICRLRNSIFIVSIMHLCAVAVAVETTFRI